MVIDGKEGEVIHKDRGEKQRQSEKMIKGEKYENKGIN